MNCPRCGSNKIIKGGIRAGKQRYKCTECRAAFTEGVEYRSYVPIEKRIKKCPKCGSLSIVGKGKLIHGEQRYECRHCHNSFSEKTPLDKEYLSRKSCPYCGSTLNYSGYGKRGQIEYYCPNCKKSCGGDLKTGDPIKNQFFREINKDVKCPYCNSLNLRKMGIVNGKPRYKCNSCKRTFRDGIDVKIHSIEERNQVIEEVLHGGDIKKIAEKHGYSEYSVRSLARPYYSEEKLTDKQKKLIITYGYYFDVPVEYIAEYVPCSRITCKKVLDAYKEKAPKSDYLKNKTKSTILGAMLKNLSKIYCSSSVQNE